LREASVKKLKSFPIDKLAIVPCGSGILITGLTSMATTGISTMITGLVE